MTDLCYFAEDRFGKIESDAISLGCLASPHFG
jgi:hypothetical protein